jgi:hypothetical protein
MVGVSSNTIRRTGSIKLNNRVQFFSGNMLKWDVDIIYEMVLWDW